MRVAFFGNNLNAGFNFVRALRELGTEAELFFIPSEHRQDRPDWWDAQSTPRCAWVHTLDDFDAASEEPFASLGGDAPLVTHAPVRRLYDALRGYDLVVASENGPALLSEFDATPKVFLSFGFDLQVLPFYVSIYCRPAITSIVREHWRRMLNGQRSLRDLRNDLRDYVNGLGRRYYRVQQRQRRGIRQCAVVLCAPYQRRLARRIGVPGRRITHLPLLPMDPRQLAEVDEGLVAELRRRYVDADLLLLHPTRQFYRRENGNRFLKDNDKLLRAFARFVHGTQRRVRLVLVEKGRDLDDARRLIRELALAASVEWIPELPNYRLRAYYRLPQLVVCDQFNPQLASLGNIGREASFFGRPLVTAFGADNAIVYPGDPPPHVFPAQTEAQVLASLQRVAALSPGDREAMGLAARAWFHRHFDSANAVPRYLEVLRAVHEGQWRG
jgi:glycosyltransferase involved in cell wall biosynthesis